MTAAQRSACFLNVSGWVPLHPAPTCPVLLALWAVRARVRVGPPGGRVRPAFWGQCGRVPTRSAPAGELCEEGRSPGAPCGPRRARSSRTSRLSAWPSRDVAFSSPGEPVLPALRPQHSAWRPTGLAGSGRRHRAGGGAPGSVSATPVTNLEDEDQHGSLHEAWPGRDAAPVCGRALPRPRVG